MIDNKQTELKLKKYSEPCRSRRQNSMIRSVMKMRRNRAAMQGHFKSGTGMLATPICSKGCTDIERWDLYAANTGQ